jgi:16S rRNA C967 or C1407 C5-methylase (RsmB/RsmF family)
MKRTNPLSDARNSFARHKERKDSVPLRAAAVWHRKSGAGYSLFLEYYSGQPSGIVADTSVGPTVSSAGIKMGVTLDLVGGSKAAKRRRRQKLKNDPSLIAHEPPTIRCAEVLRELPHTCPSQLIQVFHQTPSSHHLIDFISCISKPLPITFRLRQSTEEHTLSRLTMFLQQLALYSSHIQPISINTSTTGAIFQSTGKVFKDNLKNTAPDLHLILLEASTSGLIARQDIGSMLPLLALSSMGYIKFGFRVLDLCASPGSKTMQALEVITNPKATDMELNKLQHQTNSTIGRPGRIVANDISKHRLTALQEAVKRSGMSDSLLNRITYTNYDASQFPTPKSGKLFDCVIADVPCSGDGTIRKDKTILPGWMPNIGNSLHEIQLRILQRALELTRVGGVVAYSTCSLNPVENEAVVAAALRWANTKETSVVVLDWPHHLVPYLRRREGVAFWRVAHHETTLDSSHCDTSHNDVEASLTWYENFNEAQSSQSGNLPNTLWPQQEYTYYSLNKCIRLWPQDQDTGGFFLALLLKQK